MVNSVTEMLAPRLVAQTLSAALLVLVTLSSLTLAQAQPATPSEPFDEIQVTATRRPASASDVAAALTLVQDDVVRGQKLVTDSLAAQPGVFLQQTTPGQGAAIVRGLKGSEILHLVDGLRMNNAIFRNAPTQYLALVSPASVERIEVLRGSPASLYGSDAVGGVVQVISRLPEFDGGSLQLRREFGLGLDSAEAQRSVYASVDVGNDRLAGLLSGNYLDTGDRQIGGGDRVAPSGYSARAFRGALSYRPDDESLWLLDFQHGRQPKTPRVDELVPGFGQTDPTSEEFFFAPNERNFLHLRHDRSSGWLNADWRLDLGWQQIVDDRQTRSFGSDVRRLEDNSSDLFGLSLTASGEMENGSWVIGSELYRDEVASRRRDLDLSTGVVTDAQPRFPDGSTVDQAAVFGNAELDLSDRQSLSGGLRFTRVDVDLAGTLLFPAATVDTNDFSADIGWRFSVDESTTLIANAGLGFRAPNVFDLGTLGERPGNRFNVPNPNLESEHIVQLDFGIRHSGERLSAQIVAWRFSYNDRIASVLTGESTPDGREIVQTRNRASAELWGVEAELNARITDNWLAALTLNYTRGDQEIGDGVDEPADRVPPLNGRLRFDYGINSAWTLTPYLLFAGSQDRLSERDANDPRIDPEGTDGWLTANLSAAWQPGDRWSLRIMAMNLLDERYRVHGSGLDAPGRNLAIDFRVLW